MPFGSAQGTAHQLHRLAGARKNLLPISSMISSAFTLSPALGGIGFFETTDCANYGWRLDLLLHLIKSLCHTDEGRYL